MGEHTLGGGWVQCCGLRIAKMNFLKGNSNSIESSLLANCEGLKAAAGGQHTKVERGAACYPTRSPTARFSQSENELP